MIVPVILSGGVGSRLWPLSRGAYPKQLLPLGHPELSMLQQTVQRAAELAQCKAPIVVCNEEHRFIVGEQLSQLSPSKPTIMLEPVGRNTAPAIAIAAFQAMLIDSNPVLLVMPADHMIADQASYANAVDIGHKSALDGNLVTFGIVPQSPETGYGYIKAGSRKGEGFTVAEFKEKPAKEVAQAYLDSGGYYWNGGIFMFNAETYLNELNKFAPQIYAACEQAVLAAVPDLDFIRVESGSFESSPSDSIDYAVMENTDRAIVVPLDAGWSDVGSWSALWDVSDKDSNGNALHGDVLTYNTKNSHIYAESKLVSTIGVENLVVVQTDDAVMVAGRDHAQDVKQIVHQLKQHERSQVDHHRKVFRPWGWYDSIDAGERFQVKRIQVKPGAKLSVQLHHHRAEHWVVVKGQAEILNGERTFTLNENESTYIPIGVKHALRNPSDSEALEIIEVQSGSYLGEDDIVRFEDLYGRLEQ